MSNLSPKRDCSTKSVEAGFRVTLGFLVPIFLSSTKTRVLLPYVRLSLVRGPVYSNDIPTLHASSSSNKKQRRCSSQGDKEALTEPENAGLLPYFFVLMTVTGSTLLLESHLEAPRRRPLLFQDVEADLASLAHGTKEGGRGHRRGSVSSRIACHRAAPIVQPARLSRGVEHVCCIIPGI